MQNTNLSTGIRGFIAASPVLSTAQDEINFAYDSLTLMARKRFGGGGSKGGASGVRGLLFLLVLVAIIPLVILVITGPNTGNTGIYGNAVISNNIRNSAATYSSFFVVIVLLVVIKILEGVGI